MDLGGGVTIDRASWDKILLLARNPSIFCKELAISMWPLDELRTRSVTGKQSKAVKNRELEAKQPLTPVKIQAIKSNLT